jgi:hypothetical protein
MSIVSKLVITVCFATAFTTGCVTDEADTGEPDTGEPDLGTAESELDVTPVPYCQDTVDEQSERRVCGIKPNGSPAYKWCTRTCITHRHIDLSVVPSQCVVDLTGCTFWVCGECNDD